MKNTLLTASAAAAVIAGCGASGPTGGDAGLSGQIIIDGSSTVAPISEAVSEEFGNMYQRVRVPVGTSGTGGGFKKFLNGETEVSNASRPIKDSELELARQNGVEFIELPIAYDGLSVMVHPDNNWVDYLTVDELKRIWEPGSQITRWNQIRPEWPNRPLKLYAPGHESGTYDYFTEAIVGREGASRSDPSVTFSEDDNVLVMGIAGDSDSLGFFGYAYYANNQARLKLVPVDGGSGPVSPSLDTIRGGQYAPLSRPLFIYVRADVADRPEVREFVKFYLTEGAALVQEVGYIPLSDDLYRAALERFETKVTGSAYPVGSHMGQTLYDLYIGNR